MFLEAQRQVEAERTGSAPPAVSDMFLEAQRQVTNAGGRPVVWHVADEKAATAIKSLVGRTGVTVVHTPVAGP
jgi:hypothetical protein